ncbi:hypothetical protein ACFQGA_09235 [Marinobacter koreensis]|uniref:Uncharacterized protein n=1 Tax=Marinobacter koreensis TaxID=335974 RepID=A0ABW0RMW9_9GAMM|nr:hypothetical protein [Marinobacter koreensis]MCK7547129.1 hypothetical protein [Marinobacter koreensis]
MAENPETGQQAPDTTSEPILRPGRAADPLPARAGAGEAGKPDGRTPAEPNPEAVSESPVRESEGAESGTDEGAEPDAPERMLAESRQRKLRLLLRQCDRVLLMDFDVLAMSGWPDNYSMAAARRRRDIWTLSAVIAAALFLSGLSSFVPAWLAGGAFGAFVIILLLGVPVIRRVYSSKPSFLDLVLLRQRLLSDARKHAAHLEGEAGLVWQCVGMADFNPALKNTRFSELVRLSERRALPRYLTRREHVRLYLIFLLEAEKAYGRVQQAFFEGNQVAIDRGWQSVAAEPEPRT